MDSLETYITEFLLKTIHRSSPAMTPDDDAKVTKAVQDFVTTAVDLTAVFFAIRNAKPATK